LELSHGHGRTVILERLEKRTHKNANRIMDLEVFKLLSDWYCLPLLELIKTKSFHSEPKWIARRLGITQAEVKETLDRLARLGVIEVQNEKIIGVSKDFLITSSDISSAAIKKHHIQMLERAGIALNSQAPE